MCILTTDCLTVSQFSKR
uniref:Uncharacterized protein n=1 Tax=Anguilla anguilla TaxID=7936 RepID=A0A0E9PJ92_ANGAN